MNDNPSLSSSAQRGLTADQVSLNGYVWYVIGLLTLVAVLAPLIRADLQLSDSEFGVLLGFAFALFYALCGLPIARWADRGNRSNIIALALGTWSVMTALAGSAQHFWHLFLTRVGVGAGEAGGLAPALGVPGLALALIVRLTLREVPRGRFEIAVKQATSPLSLLETLAVLWRCRTYRLLVLFMGMNSFVQYGLLQWWPSFYARVFELSLSPVGLSLGLAFGTGSGLGVLPGGVIGTRAAYRDARLPLRIGAMALIIALPAPVASLLVSSPSVSLLLVSVTQLCWGLLAGPVYATLYSVTRPQMRAAAGAIMVFAVSVVGLGPFCVGVLSDLLSPAWGLEALRYALLAPLVLFPALIVAVHAATKTLGDDLAAAGATPSAP